ncbi:MAG: VWA domain-containing protein [Myxococcota bacterium]
MMRFVCIITGSLALSGCEISIANPERLGLLVLGPAILLAAFLVQRRRSVLLKRFAGETGDRLITQLAPWRRRLRAVMLAVGVCALALSLAGMRVGYRWETVNRRGVDLIIALDVSRSMEVRDADGTGKLSRLVRAKREVIDLLGLLAGDRVGLVVFAGTAVARCPLTTDYKTAELLLRDVDSGLVPVQGTDIGAAITVAVDGFKRGPGQSQAILLITDGEDHIGESDVAVARAKELGIRIFAIGIGKPKGAPVPGERGGFHTDRAGNVVMSRLEESALENLALSTGGRYVRSVTGDIDLEQVYTEGIRRTVEARDLASKREKKWYDRFQWLLALALLVLALEPLIGDGRPLSRDNRAEVKL